MSPSLNFVLLAAVLCATADAGPITDHAIPDGFDGTFKRVVIPLYDLSMINWPRCPKDYMFRVFDDNDVTVATNTSSSSTGDTYPYLSVFSTENEYPWSTFIEVGASLEFLMIGDYAWPLHVEWPSCFTSYSTTPELFSSWHYDTPQKYFSYYDYDTQDFAVTLFGSNSSKSNPFEYSYKFKMGDKCLHKKGKRVTLRECEVTASQNVEIQDSGLPLLADSADDPVKINVGGSWLREGLNKEWHILKSRKKNGDKFTFIPLYWTPAGPGEALDKRWTFQIMEEESGECLSFDEARSAMVYLPCEMLPGFGKRWNHQAIDLEVVITDCRTTGCPDGRQFGAGMICEDFYSPGIWYCAQLENFNGLNGLNGR